MKRISVGVAVFLLLAAQSLAQEFKRPVFFLRYDGTVGYAELNPEELEEEDEAKLATESCRHKITLRIKEQWSDGFTTNLYSAVSWKTSAVLSDEYTYFYLNPNCIWDISDRLRWRSEFRSKWSWDVAPSQVDYPPELTSLLAKTELTYKVLDQLRIIPSFRGVFDLDQDSTKVQQTYTAGLRFESKINPQMRLNGHYRGILRAPLGDESDVSNLFKNEFGFNLSWDPNK
jgi:hypothetical protein